MSAVTKREGALGRHILLAVVAVAVGILWNLNASDQVQASQISRLEDRATSVEAMFPVMGSEVTQIRITLEAAEISRQHLLRNGEPNGP